MDDYKVLKEAFHANNAGGSIWSINAVSVAALSSYALYASTSRTRAYRPAVDFVTMVLPILLGVTVFANRPYTFNAILLAVAGFFYLQSSSNFHEPASRMGSSMSGGQQKSKGEWLDESDSDEEPAEPLESASLQVPPSRPISAMSSSISRPSSPTPSSSMLQPETPTDQKARKRRHSPTPSTHNHTAIDILPTPEMSGPGRMVNQQSTYPSPTAARLKQVQGKLPFLSVYRAHMMIMTLHCILAVDFKVFPRDQGKCEDFGTSLMDVGVGSFVFSLGVVSTKTFASGGSQSSTQRLAKSMYKSIPLVLLGMIRVITVKGSEYPEHVTEYGVHWNFFFTLALLPVFGTILWPVRESTMRWSVIAILLALGHELCLNKAGLLNWVLSSDRVGLLGMNKEGIVSLPGYAAIYCVGLSTGEHIMRAIAPARQSAVHIRSQEEHIRRHIDKRRTELALELFSYAFGWWIAVLAVRMSGYEVSRRIANLTYVLWVAAYNTTFLFGYLVLEITLFSSNGNPVPPLLEAINNNGLAIFLAGNVLTGLINLSMRTMYASDATATIVLIAYSGALCTVAWLGRGVRLKISIEACSLLSQTPLVGVVGSAMTMLADVGRSLAQAAA